MQSVESKEIVAAPPENIARSAGIVSLAVLMSRLTGLLRETLMAHLFGAGMVYDAFLLGFRIPNLARDLFAEGALSSAFIPTFTEYLTQKTKQEAAALANLVASALVVIVGSVCVLGVVLSPWLVQLLAPGYALVPGKMELAIQMTRIMFPFLLLVALAAQAMGILNACNQFAIPALASTFFNIGSVCFGLTLGWIVGPHIGIHPITGMAWGVVLGGALQLLWQIPSLRKSGFYFRPDWNWSHPGLRHIMILMGPAILGNAAVQINVLVNTNFASRLYDPVSGFNGPASWLSYAFRFMQLPLGLFGVAIASATLPSISRSANSGNLEDFRRTVSRALGMVFLLTIPSSVGLIVLGQSMIGAIYQSGRFQAYDTSQTGLALSCYAVGLAGYSALKVLNPAFYALRDTRTPMVVSLLSVLINYCTASMLVHYAGWGHAGLALSTSAVALFGFVVLLWMLRNRIGGIRGRELRSSALKISFSSALMGATVMLTGFCLRHWLGVSKLERLADLAISIPLGIIIFTTICRVVHVPELEMALHSLPGALSRKLPFLRAKIAIDNVA